MAKKAASKAKAKGASAAAQDPKTSQGTASAKAAGAKGKALSDKDLKKMMRSKKGADKKPGELSRVQKIVIVAFIVIFAFSTLASALASVVQGQQSQQSSESQSSSDTKTVESVDEKYQPTVNTFEERVSQASEPEAADLLALARYYFSWGGSVRDIASTDDETSHANELLEKAVGYYDQYLEREDSNAARVDRAMCKYYEGDTTAALTALQEVVDADSTYAYAWANLGLVYESKGSTSSAKEAYNNAVANDPNNEYGAKSYAQKRLDAIAKSEESAEATSSVQSVQSGTGVDALQNDLDGSED